MSAWAGSPPPMRSSGQREIALRRAEDRRARFARRRIASISSDMSRLTIELAAGADKPGLSIRRDDVEIDCGLLGTSLPVDRDDTSWRRPRPVTIRGRPRFTCESGLA